MIQDTFDLPIFITGIERSGTTVIARIIESCGVYTGNVSEMCENIRIKEMVDQYYLNSHIPTNSIFKMVQYKSSSKASLNSQYPLLNTKEICIPVNWKYTIKDQLEFEITKKQENRLWMYKSNRLCQMWPVWNYAFPNAKWIIVRRRTGDIIQSCLKIAYMNAFKDLQIQKAIGVNNEKEGWAWWVHEHEKLFVEMIEAGLNCKVIWPERMVNGDYSQIFEMLEWLGLKWNDDIIPLTNKLLWNSPQMKERSK